MNALEEKPVDTLTNDQATALQMATDWAKSRDSNELRLGGYAGTGKSWLVRKIVDELSIATATAAFTGKAVSVLRNNGLHGSQTLHSLLYDIRKVGKKVEWIPKPFLPCDLVIVDESSMISTSLYEDLKRHRVKVLFVGDPAQLEPIGDNPNLMRDCDYVLTEIRRQAEDNPILKLATQLRQGNTKLKLGHWENEQGSLTVTDNPYGIDIAQFSMIVCGKNRTRHTLNEKRRRQLKYDKQLELGERIICLKNDRKSGLFNGMILEVNEIEDKGTYYEISAVDEAGDKYEDVWVTKKYFGKDYKHEFGNSRLRQPLPFDYATALTCHKCQGSQAEDVLVLQEWLYNTDMARWAYTATTRSQKNLTIVKS
jgi:exodeoxyribonuclease-5